MNTSASDSGTPRLTSLAHGGGCGCKIAPGVLSDLLASMPAAQPYANLLVGNETGDDAAVYKLNDQQALVATTDFFMPVVDDPYHFGQIAAANALSDVYAMGATPIMALALVGVPINVLPPSDIAGILQGGANICEQAGIPVAGGHSIDSVEPIYGLAAMGLVHPAHVKRNADAKAGDVLILSKALGIGIYSAAFKQNRLADDQYQAMLASTTQLNRPGATLAQMPGVHAITDVTGFGLLGHTLEMARASGLAAELNQHALPWLPGVINLAEQGVVTGASGRNWASYGAFIELPGNTSETTRALLCDPQTSGGLLISCSPETAPKVLDVLHSEGFNYATVIGQLRDGTAKVEVTDVNKK